MPISKVEVNLYECAKCGYKWVNWKDGKEKPKPNRCAKCKRWDWEEGYLGGYEKHLRRLLMWIERQGGRGCRRDKLTPICWNFLYNTIPKPTEDELEEVMGPNSREAFYGFYGDYEKEKQEREERHKRMAEIISRKKSKGLDINTAERFSSDWDVYQYQLLWANHDKDKKFPRPYSKWLEQGKPIYEGYRNLCMQ